MPLDGACTLEKNVLPEQVLWRGQAQNRQSNSFLDYHAEVVGNSKNFYVWMEGVYKTDLLMVIDLILQKHSLT